MVVDNVKYDVDSETYIVNNWDTGIRDDHRQKVEKQAKKCENVKLFYLDVFSDPIKTNLSEITQK